MIIIKQVFDKLLDFNRPLKKFMSEIFLTVLSTPGNINFRNLSRHCNYHEKTISRNFKNAEVNFPKLNEDIVKEVSIEESIIAVDCSFIKKSGKKTYGLGKFYNSKLGKSETGLEISSLCLIDVNDNTAYSIDTKQTPPESIPNKSRVDFYRQQVIDNKDIFVEARHVVCDGYYTKLKFVSGVVESGRHFVGKLRKDANLKYYYYGIRTGKQGAPKKYDGKVNLYFDYAQ